jgi:hypothetical protein
MRRKTQHTRMIIDAIVSNRVRLTETLLWAVRRHQGHPEASGIAGVATLADVCWTCMTSREKNGREAVAYKGRSRGASRSSKRM